MKSNKDEVLVEWASYNEQGDLEEQDCEPYAEAEAMWAEHQDER